MNITGAKLDDISRIGRRLGACLSTGDTVFFYGSYGAGKTTLARSIIRTWVGSDIDIPSPSFTLVQEYENETGDTLQHIDLDRLAGLDGAFELGLPESFDTHITIVEWPEVLTPIAPARRIECRLSLGAHPETERNIQIERHGEWQWSLSTIT